MACFYFIIKTKNFNIKGIILIIIIINLVKNQIDGKNQIDRRQKIFRF